MTLITEITVNGNKVFTTYNRNGNTYDGFDVCDSRDEAITKANEMMSWNVFNNDFYTNTKTELTIR